MEKKLYEAIQEVVSNDDNDINEVKYSAKFEKEWPAKYSLEQTSSALSSLFNAMNRITLKTDADPDYMISLITKHIPAELPSGKKLHKLIPELKKFAKTAKEMKKLINDARGEFDKSKSGGKK